MQKASAYGIKTKLWTAEVQFNTSRRVTERSKLRRLIASPYNRRDIVLQSEYANKEYFGWRLAPSPTHCWAAVVPPIPNEETDPIWRQLGECERRTRYWILETLIFEIEV
jgi:hypothetical protein